MRKLAFCIVLLLPFVYIYSQDLDYYYVEFKEGDVPQNIQKTVNTDQTLTLSMDNSNLAAAFNQKPIYTFKRAFLYNLNPVLDRIYLVGITTGVTLHELTNRVEIERLEQVFFNEQLTANVEQFTILPNDYDDIITGGRNTALDLIRAPLAWTITRGEGQVMGWSDAKIYDHEDLSGKVIYELNIPPYSQQGDLQFTHGAATAGMAAAHTNNNIGIASVAPDATIASSPDIGLDNIEALIETFPEIRVINASWGGCSSMPSPSQAMKYQDFLDQGYLVVAVAGNDTCTEGTLFYPASYDATLAVTTVGHRVAPTYSHNIVDGTGTIPGWFRSWKDVYRFRPDIEGNMSGHNLRANIDVTAPGHLLVGLNLDISTNPFGSGYNIKTATSPTAPLVTGIAALVFAANPNLTAQQAKDIIINTTDEIYHIPWNEPFIGQLGSGRVNAYRAVLTAKCMDDPNYIGELDLMVRNSMVDYGYEPDINTEEVFWNSQEMWVRHNSGESYIDVHQNPEYDPIEPNYVNVRVTNRSCITSSGNDTLELYWAKSHAAPSIWPDLWDGSMSMNGVTLGGQIATVSIPELTPGKEAILEIPWLVPNPDDFQNIGIQPWHFCLVARIVSNDDPMTTVETSNLPQNVMNNNNIAWKNMNIIDVVPNTPGVGSITGVGNFSNQSKSYKLVLKADENESGSPIYEEAEVGIELDDVLFDAWERGGRQGTGFLVTSNAKKLIATDDNLTLDNLQFLANEFGTAYLTFNFLTKKLTNKRLFTYHVIQKDYGTNEMVGGVTYEIRKQPRDAFIAQAGDDEEIDRSDSITLQAADINEDAIYNWYDVDGNLIYTGTSITVSPQFTQQYKLEVISNLDGLKDYDELQVTVNPYKIESLVPNPATTTVTVNYIADEATSAYLMVLHQNSGNTSNYIIDTEENSHTIDLSGFASGLYSIILVCDGEIQGSKNLSKQ
ncbi:S8 family serine peptidase [Planktosalinus lacus]|uniref:Peptidase S8/S53 domain-containing protein n=1 Tax=Planktosalinus lacus TaxID=1526573 RepID=A0A8J2Y7M3_9FLAO|nr:S8 family serine peptidase [Planktosalinus lacus]GGD82069.1 hypothetical protein GCM10011312_03010 [Planktosalinus lacus]